jgi:GTP cyclohydrolase I
VSDAAKVVEIDQARESVREELAQQVIDAVTATLAALKAKDYVAANRHAQTAKEAHLMMKKRGL